MLSTKLRAIADQFTKALAEADSAVASTKGRWEQKRKVIEGTYEKLLRELCSSALKMTAQFQASRGMIWKSGS